MSHFIQHRELNEELSVWNFLEMHYFGHDINDNDQEEDMKLPFKKIDGHQMLSWGVPEGKIKLLHILTQNISAGSGFRYQFFIPNSFTTSLLRPPIG